MAHEAKILKHSISPDGVPLCTFEIKIPRIVLAEFNTHRVFSRNSASSRAIPVEKMIKMVQEDPYIPSSWGKNQKGMQAGIDLDERDASKATAMWLHARDAAVEKAEKLLDLGVHKQITNRLLEPFMWHTIIVTATEWSNFFHLRNNPMAHPDIQIPARMMQELYKSSVPEELDYGEWHLPLIGPEDYFAAFDSDIAQVDNNSQTLMKAMVKVSVGRSARVFYLTHDGKRDLAADIALHDSLLAAGHMSPFEHVARPATFEDWHVARDESLKNTPVRYAPELEVVYNGDAPYARLAPQHQWHGNFRGWKSYRKTIPHEADILGPR